MKFFHAISLCFVVLMAGAVCLAQGHIEANVPEKENFDTYLKRDLNTYFSANADNKIKVEYELLRKPPTQVGVAYPKFYAWVKVLKDNTLQQQGAVRIAAIEQEEFQITDFVSAEKIRREPQILERTFPAALCPKIVELAGQR